MNGNQTISSCKTIQNCILRAALGVVVSYAVALQLLLFALGSAAAFERGDSFAFTRILCNPLATVDGDGTQPPMDAHHPACCGMCNVHAGGAPGLPPMHGIGIAWAGNATRLHWASADEALHGNHPPVPMARGPPAGMA